jgi:lactoylglutathione lyase
MPIHLTTLNYIIIFASDMERSLLFYRDTLGLPLKFSSPGWTEFATGSTIIALHQAHDAAQMYAQGRSPAGQAQLGFQVADLDSAYTELQSLGVHFSVPPSDQPEGIRVAVLHDPDGLGITLQQTL